MRAADDVLVRRPLGLVAPLAVVVAALLAVPAPSASGATGTAAPPAGRTAAANAPPAPIAGLQTALADAAAEATRLAGELETAAARAGGLRVELDRLAEQQEAARSRVDTRARQAYLAVGRADPLAGLVAGLAAPDLHALAAAELGRRGAAAAVRAAVELADAVDEHSAAALALQEQAAVHRAGLQTQAAEALEAQESARRLLADAEAALAVEEARARTAQVAAAARARTAELVAARAALSTTRAQLDGASAAVTKALTPAQTRRSQGAAAREAPVLALVEAAGSGYPAGYAPTGTVLRGVASWYGPGFVGSPTASGTPYDPERHTCAHKTLPFGTVLRVSRGDRAVSCLVNDRGPFVGDRILDLSRAGSRALGFDGIAAVVAEVLAPAG
jgi:rare lipoprotein A